MGGLDSGRLPAEILRCCWSPQKRNKLTAMMLRNEINAELMTEAISAI